jgi:serine/threonine-protein kinase HipA
MSMNGKRDNFLMEDFIACEKTAGMKRGRAKAIVAEVQSAVSRWPDVAEEVGVNILQRYGIQSALRINAFT